MNRINQFSVEISPKHLPNKSYSRGNYQSDTSPHIQKKTNKKKKKGKSKKKKMKKQKKKSSTKYKSQDKIESPEFNLRPKKSRFSSYKSSQISESNFII
jgi:hypothetical protein